MNPQAVRYAVSQFNEVRKAISYADELMGDRLTMFVRQKIDRFEAPDVGAYLYDVHLDDDAATLWGKHVEVRGDSHVETAIYIDCDSISTIEFDTLGTIPGGGESG